MLLSLMLVFTSCGGNNSSSLDSKKVDSVCGSGKIEQDADLTAICVDEDQLVSFHNSKSECNDDCCNLTSSIKKICSGQGKKMARLKALDKMKRQNYYTYRYGDQNPDSIKKGLYINKEKIRSLVAELKE